MDFLRRKDAPKLPGSKRPAILVGAFAAIGGILFGYDTASISGVVAMDAWIKTMATHTDANGDPVVTTGEISLVVSILSAGTFLGALLSGPLGDRLGRRWGLIVSCFVFCVGAALQTAASGLPLFIAGRVVAGLGVGLVSALVPLYQSESAPKQIRGTIVGCYQLCINIGLILAAVANNSTAYREDKSAYRIPVGIQIIFGVALALGMVFLPETPRYLIKIGKTDDALASLGFLHGLPIDHAIINQEYREILANLELERAKGGASYLTCWRPPFLKRQITGCVLQALQQLSGINFIIYYGTRFFLTSGIKDPFLITMITNIVAFVSTIPGLYLVETMGRRNLLLAGAVGMTVCQVIVGAVGVSTDSQVSNIVLIVFVCFYLFFFEFSWGPCAWIVTGEIFPLHIRAKALSMTTSSNWLFNFILAFVTPYMVDSGPGNAGLGVKVFFVWTAFCLIAVVFVWALIYETKGLSLEQVDELYNLVDKAWKSPAYKRRGSLAVGSEATWQGETKEHGDGYHQEIEEPKH